MNAATTSSATDNAAAMAESTTLEDVEIFAAGTHTDSGGHKRTWTEQDLQRVAELYNGQRDHQAPAVIGHPKTDDPAFGWLDRVMVKGRKLVGRFVQVAPAFKEALAEGRYKMRSIALYPDLLIRHVGFLGAQPPAVKGLAPLRFAEATREAESATTTVIEFAETITEDTTAMEELLKQVLAAVTDLASRYDAGTKGASQQTEDQSAGASDSSGEHAELERLRAENLELRKKGQLAEFNEFLSSEEMRSRVTPAMRPFVLDQMSIMAGLGEYEFSEGGKRLALEAFKEELKKLPKQIEFGERATNGSAAERTDDFATEGTSIAKASTR